MSEHDDPLRRAYRALANEEPPRELDEAILAAARRAVARPSLARRWGVPVSIAALLVIALGVTLEMQRGKPRVELEQRAAPPALEQESAAPAARAPVQSLRAPAAPASAPAPASTRASPAAPAAANDPRALLEKIAGLRAAGRDAHADRALEDFRKRFPDYRIDAAMWERVKPR